MAFRDFGQHAQYKDSVKDITKILDKVDLDDPDQNIIEKEISTNELLKIQAEAQAKTLSEAINFITKLLPLGDITDDHQIIAEQPGGKVNVQAQQDYLTKIAEKNNLLTKMLQQRHEEKNSKSTGSYFDDTRDPICAIPPQIINGTQTQVSDSALKLLTSFTGDTDKEAENLRTFFRAVYDVAITNRLTEICTVAVLKRKLTGTARRLIDAYELELDEADRPNLKEIVLKLENRYMADLQPELANARLSMMKKDPHHTYQMVEGEISELVSLAARGEKGDKTAWIKQRKIEVFKQCIEEKDRQLLFRENQSRNISGLGEMNLSQAVDFLIKNYSEQNAFTQANQIRNKSASEYESIQTVKETNPKINQKKKKREQAIAKKAAEEQKVKDELFRVYENQKHPNSNQTQFQPFQRGRGRARGRGGPGRPYNRGRGGQFQNQRNGGFKPNNWNNNGNQNPNWNSNSNTSKTIPRKFVTPEMVGVDPNSCLKCNSPTHRFQEQDKCIYGSSSLMTRACGYCKEGGHHTSICIKSQKSTIGAPSPKEPLDPKFSKWPEATKAAAEEQYYQPFAAPKNDWLPSLFPQ